MLNFNGGTGVAGTSIAPMSMFAGYLLLESGDVALAICFLILSSLYFLFVICTLCRYFINYRRNRHLLDY